METTQQKKSFHELIQQGETPVLVDFYAHWCGPCQTLSPIVAEVAGEMRGKMKVVKIDIDKNQGAARQFHVSSIPTLILFHKGQILWRKTGLLTKRELVSSLNNVITQS